MLKRRPNRETQGDNLVNARITADSTEYRWYQRILHYMGIGCGAAMLVNRTCTQVRLGLCAICLDKRRSELTDRQK